MEIVSYGFVLPHWAFWGGMLVFPAIFLMLARMRAKADEARSAQDHVTTTDEVEEDEKKPAWTPPGNLFTRMVDKVSEVSGGFTSLWTVIAVLFYTFEVIARYFFNAPTNWVHEAAFLMFGMMYTISGAACYLADGHVRVDLFYANWSPRGRAASDLIMSTIFYVFALAFLFTGWIFASQGLDQNVLPTWLAQGYQFDISQSEWQVAYWPVKFMIPLGGFLICVQGASRFIKDLQTFRYYGEAQNAG